MSCDFLAGNTRLRARWPQLLTTADHDRLVGSDLDGLAAALAGTAYRPHLEVTRALGPGSQLGGQRGSDRRVQAQLEAAIGARLTAVLAGLHGVYSGAAAEVVSVLLGRWDVPDLRTLLRGVAREVSPDQVLALVAGVGALAPSTAREVAQAPDVPTALDRLAAADLPSRGSARALHEAARAFELHGDLTELDRAVSVAAVLGWRQILQRAGRAGRAVAALVTAEVDAANLVAAVRLQDAAERSEISLTAELLDRHLLPGGSHDVDALAAVAAGARPGPVMPRYWRPALDRWERSGDPAALAGDLQAAVCGAALAGWRADPMGAGVPVAYVLTAEREARNLRLLVHAAGSGLAARSGRGSGSREEPPWPT